MTELMAVVNDEIPKGYISYHLNLTDVRANPEVKALKKAIKKRKKEENKRDNQGNKNGTENIDIFEDMQGII